MNKSNLESLMNARGLLSIFVMMLALLFATSSIADEDNEEEEERPEYVVV